MKTLGLFGIYLTGALLLLACGTFSGKTSDKNSGSGPDTFAASVQPVMQKNCYSCHGTGGSAFDLGDETSVRNNAKLIASVLTAAKMPPPKSGITLSADDKTTILNFVNGVQ